MSDTYPPVTPYEGGTETNTSSGTADVAKEQAANVTSQAADAGKQVAGVAKEEVANIASEAKNQAKDLVGQAKSQLSDQVTTQQERVASGLSGLSDELKKMARSSEDGGFATDLIHTAADRVSSAASWLESKQPSDLLDEVSNFARRKPGLFIGISALAGVLVGRLTRSIVSEAADAKAEAAAPQSSTYLTETPVTTTDAYVAPDYSVGTTDYVEVDTTYTVDETPLSGTTLPVDNEPYRSTYGDDRR